MKSTINLIDIIRHFLCLNIPGFSRYYLIIMLQGCGMPVQDPELVWNRFPRRASDLGEYAVKTEDISQR